MAYQRRAFLKGGAAAAALMSCSSLRAQEADTVTEFSRIFGQPDVRDGDLDLLREMQENREQVPMDLEGYQEYLEKSPLTAATRTLNNDLYHLVQWNSIALDLTAQDHATIAGKTDEFYAEQFGPHRSSWALAIFHLALFEAVNAITKTHKSYMSVQTEIYKEVKQDPKTINAKSASIRAALAYAALETLSVLYRNKIAFTKIAFNKLQLIIDDDLSSITLGSKIGTAAAQAVLATRKYDPKSGTFGDGSRAKAGESSLKTEPKATDFPSGGSALDWEVDPISQLPIALGGHWGEVKPFVVSNLHLPPPPPTEGDAKFRSALRDVRTLGGDPGAPNLPRHFKTPTSRKGSVSSPVNASNETLKGIFWAYDGTALLCAPPRMYNQIALSVAFRESRIRNVANLAQYLAIINTALGDAGIGSWSGKYQYRHARPVTYIRKTDPDGTVLGGRNKEFTPLGAQVSNGTPMGANLTPPFPSYPSGHATFGGALFEVMRLYHGSDLEFRFVSDEYNGINRGPVGQTRPRFERVFASLTEAELENARSRIWLGIHWQYDADEGIKQGRRIATDVFNAMT